MDSPHVTSILRILRLPNTSIMRVEPALRLQASFCAPMTLRGVPTANPAHPGDVDSSSRLASNTRHRGDESSAISIGGPREGRLP